MNEWKQHSPLSTLLMFILPIGCVTITGCPPVEPPPADPCDGVTCTDDETCKDGVCVADDTCADVTCADGQTCVDGECVGGDPCGDLTCADGQTCVDGECVTEGTDPPPARVYVGSERCGGCHPGIFQMFTNSGHPYKINEIIDGEMPTYPFSSMEGALEMVADDDLPLPDDADPNLDNTDNQLGTPMSFDDVSFVIGGYGWKARFIDLDGFIVTGNSVQYNLETGGMASYHNNETDKVLNCGNCHTTGWKRHTSEEGEDRNLNRQNDRPGMDGTFALPGIQCEACHGAGSDHASSPSSDNITKRATPRTTEDFLAEDMAFGKPVACSDCHTRHAEKDYPTFVGGSGLILASGGLIRHHEQNDEMLGIDPDDEAAGPTGPHANLGCLTCHDPHTTTRYMTISGDPPGMNTECTECHSADEYAIASGGMTGLACTDCHMPLLAKSAIKHDAVGTGPATGDIKTHVFRIDLTKENQFTEDGKFAYPWITGQFACKTCHNGETTFNLDFPSEVKIH